MYEVGFQSDKPIESTWASFSVILLPISEKPREPVWYVDEQSLKDYKKLGLNAVVGAFPDLMGWVRNSPIGAMGTTHSFHRADEDVCFIYISHHFTSPTKDRC